VPKNVQLFIFRITLSKLTDFNVFGLSNSEKIWHQQLAHLPTSHVYCSQFTLENPKRHFSTVLFVLYFIYVISEENKLLPLTHHTWKMSLHCLVKCKTCFNKQTSRQTDKHGVKHYPDRAVAKLITSNEVPNLSFPPYHNPSNRDVVLCKTRCLGKASAEIIFCGFLAIRTLLVGRYYWELWLDLSVNGHACNVIAVSTPCVH